MQSAYFEQVIIPKSTSYAKWSLGLSITETASTSTSITISISVYMIRDSTPGDKKATGYHFDNGNSLAISVGGEQIYYDPNAAHLQIDGGVASKTLIKTVTHTDTKASDGSYTKTISATFKQTQSQGAKWNGTVSGSFKGTTIAQSNTYIYANGAWHLGTAYVYTSGGWKKSNGKVSVYNNGWKS